MPFPNNCLNCDKPMWNFRLHDRMICLACKKLNGKKKLKFKKPTFIQKLNKRLMDFRKNKK